MISPLLQAWAVGVLSGFLASIPVGPINIAIINEGVRRGFWWGVWIGLGSVAMEVTYCALAFAGFSGLVMSQPIHSALELASFTLMLFLGAKYLRVPSLPATTRSVELVEHRLHPHTAFMTGFVRVLGNPVVLLFWATLSAAFISHDWVNNNWASKGACIAGVAAGALVWFTLLSFLVSLGHGKFSTRTLVRLSHVSGAILLGTALVLGSRLVGSLARSHELRNQVRALEDQLRIPLRLGEPRPDKPE